MARNELAPDLQSIWEIVKTTDPDDKIQARWALEEIGKIVVDALRDIGETAD